MQWAYVRPVVGPQQCPRPLQVVTEQRPRACSLEVTAHVSDAGHHTPSVYQV